MKKVIFIVTIAVLLVAFGVSAWMVGSYLLDGRQQEQLNEELAQMVEDARATTETTAPGESTAETTETVPTETTEPVILASYEELHEMNADTVGWLEIPGTNLKYPVMQTPADPNFYLYKDFYGNDSVRGSVYAWSEADINAPSDNITLFGHNMKDGSMFATLNNYVNKYYWDDNSLIIFDTLYEYHTYKIFAVFRTTATLGEGFSYHKFVNAEDAEAFDEFVATCKGLALYDTGITPVYGDKLICLSTCAYHAKNGRLVVAAVRIT